MSTVASFVSATVTFVSEVWITLPAPAAIALPSAPLPRATALTPGHMQQSRHTSNSAMRSSAFLLRRVIILALGAIYEWNRFDSMYGIYNIACLRKLQAACNTMNGYRPLDCNAHLNFRGSGV
eukprot:2210-Heterococcus_DN1.PRE.1